MKIILLLALSAFSAAVPCRAESAPLLLNRQPADTSISEDSNARIFIGDVFTDPLGHPITYSAKLNPDSGSVSVSGGWMEIAPNRNFSGSVTVTLFAAGDSDRSLFTRFQLEVVPVNDPPWFEGEVPEVAFANDDSFSVDLSKYLHDLETPYPMAFKLEFDSLPGFSISAKGPILTGTAPGTISRAELILRAVDPDGGRSAPFSVRLFPNAPTKGDTIPVPRSPGNGAPPWRKLCAGKSGTFSVFTFAPGRIGLNTYLTDGSKAHAAIAQPFGRLALTQVPRMFRLGDRYLLEGYSYVGATSRSGIYLLGGNLEVAGAIEQVTNDHLMILGVDTSLKRIYVRRIVFPASGPGKTTVEAYDSLLKPLPPPAFADSLADTGPVNLQFEGGKILLVRPQNTLADFSLRVDEYGADGMKTGAFALPVDHVPANADQLPEFRGFRLVPYDGGYALFGAIQDYTPSPDGGRYYAWSDYRTFYRKYDKGFLPASKILEWPGPANDEIYPFEDFTFGPGHLLVSASESRTGLEHTTWLHAFDKNMDPVGNPAKILYDNADFAARADLVKVTERKYVELAEWRDGRAAAIFHVIDLGGLDPVSDRKPKTSKPGVRTLPLRYSGHDLLGRPVGKARP